MRKSATLFRHETNISQTLNLEQKPIMAAKISENGSEIDGTKKRLNKMVTMTHKQFQWTEPEQLIHDTESKQLIHHKILNERIQETKEMELKMNESNELLNDNIRDPLQENKRINDEIQSFRMQTDKIEKQQLELNEKLTTLNRFEHKMIEIEEKETEYCKVVKQLCEIDNVLNDLENKEKGLMEQMRQVYKKKITLKKEKKQILSRKHGMNNKKRNIYASNTEFQSEFRRSSQDLPSQATSSAITFTDHNDIEINREIKFDHMIFKMLGKSMNIQIQQQCDRKKIIAELKKSNKQLQDKIQEMIKLQQIKSMKSIPLPGIIYCIYTHNNSYNIPIVAPAPLPNAAPLPLPNTAPLPIVPAPMPSKLHFL